MGRWYTDLDNLSKGGESIALGEWTTGAILWSLSPPDSLFAVASQTAKEVFQSLGALFR
ncbi:MAG: hypothetical protein BWY17_03142 [Deltaproteobacteria bacterium ADurb.Bin207]|jgi:hypothetical protein|nr:MAG: hypothetical protein BWY17_03142 [Deltaproteobacteria bacterium ADurb.Bin207]